MGSEFDVTVSKSDKITRDYQSSTFGYSLTEKNVPEDLVSERTLELQLRITRMISHWEALEEKKTPEDALEDIKRVEQLIKSRRDKNVKRSGNEAPDADPVVDKAPAEHS